MSRRSLQVPIPRRTFLKRGALATGLALAPGLLAPGCDPRDRDPADDLPNDSLEPPDGLPATDIPTDAASDPRRTIHAVLADDLRDLPGMGREAARRLGIGSGTLSGQTVFLKPNFVVLGLDLFGVVFDPASGECTKPELVVGVAEACLEAGAARVTIAEGGQTQEAWDWSQVRFLPDNAYQGATDLQAAVGVLAGRYGADRIVLSNLNVADDWVQIPSTSTSERLRDGLFVARSFAEADLVISMPVLKTHQFTWMTAALKNFVGVAAMSRHGAGFHRCNLHLGYVDQACHGVEQAGISGAVMDICDWRFRQGRRDWAIVDGTLGLEGDGPQKLGVEAYTLDLRDRCAAGRYYVLAARDPVVADIVAARVMALDPSEVKHVRMALNLGYGVPESEILVDGASLDDLVVPDWRRPAPQTDAFFKPLCG